MNVEHEILGLWIVLGFVVVVLYFYIVRLENRIDKLESSQSYILAKTIKQNQSIEELKEIAHDLG